VRIGRRAVVGARAVVMRSVQEGKIMMGNPAREAGER
jgi:acetyltransferase-like isoleucine patch superfamily enzyme